MSLLLLFNQGQETPVVETTSHYSGYLMPEQPRKWKEEEEEEILMLFAAHEVIDERTR